MEDLKLAPSSWSVRRNKNILRPGKDCLYRDLLWSDVRYGDVLGSVPIVKDVRLSWQTLAEIFRSRLQKPEILSTTTHHYCGQQNCHPGRTKLSGSFKFVTHLGLRL